MFGGFPRNIYLEHMASQMEVFHFCCPLHKAAFFFFFCLFRAALVAYGSSQARGGIRATAAGLHHDHSNAGSELFLQPTQDPLTWSDLPERHVVFCSGARAVGLFFFFPIKNGQAVI